MSTNLRDLWKFPLRSGNSDDPRNGACLLDAVSWLEYGTLGDHPDCVCTVIAAFSRGINDAMSDAGRQRLRIFIPCLVGTVDPSAERERAEFLAWQAIRVFAPLVLDAVGQAEHAKTLREFTGSLNAAANTAATFIDYSHAGYAYAAAAYANAAATHAHAGYVYASYRDYRSKAAASYVNAAAAAANAANAAAVAVAAYDACDDKVENAMIAALDGVLKIGRRADQIPEPRFSAAVRTFELART